MKSDLFGIHSVKPGRKDLSTCSLTKSEMAIAAFSEAIKRMDLISVGRSRDSVTRGLSFLITDGQRLDAIGFVWDPHEDNWEEGFRQLQTYKKRTANCLVPQSYGINGFNLGHWVSAQRRRLATGTLSDQHKRRLDSIGFVWDPLGRRASRRRTAGIRR